jgi:hypothetical protein
MNSAASLVVRYFIMHWLALSSCQLGSFSLLAHWLGGGWAVTAFASVGFVAFVGASLAWAAVHLADQSLTRRTGVPLFLCWLGALAVQHAVAAGLVWMATPLPQHSQIRIGFSLLLTLIVVVFAVAALIQLAWVRRLPELDSRTAESRRLAVRLAEARRSA